jgi:two-component system OmpR family response regulator
MLRLEGYEVSIALDAQAAKREVETFRPDVVLLDLRMPVDDGLTFLRWLRSNPDRPPTPVAIVTADHSFDEATSNELKRLKADVYFKPVWLQDLVEITRRLIDGTTRPPSL